MHAAINPVEHQQAHEARSLAFLVMAVGVTCAFHIGKLPVAIPVLREAMGIGLVQAGFLLSMVLLAGMSLGLLIGLLADRLGPRTVMQAGLVLLAAGCNIVGNVAAGRWLSQGARPAVLLTVAYAAMAVGAAVAFAGTVPPWLQYLAVLMFSAVGGLIPGTLFGVSVQLAPDGDTVSTTVGWMQQLSALGQFVGPPAVAWLAVQVGGWQWTWVATGACSLMGVGVAFQLQRVWAERVA